MLDELPIFSLKIEQNRSSPITKFITDLTNTLLHVSYRDAGINWGLFPQTYGITDNM